MRSKSFTPGPWRVNERRHKHYALISGPNDEWESFARVVVRMEDDDDDEPEGLANARLIAAAPDLYEALRALVHDGGWDEASEARARAALDKAVPARSTSAPAQKSEPPSPTGDT